MVVKATKVVLCGLKGIGKTSLIENLVYGIHANDLALGKRTGLSCLLLLNYCYQTEDEPRSDIFPTIEDIYVGLVETDRGTKEVLRFYDTEGLVPTDCSGDIHILKPYYPIVDAFLLVYRLDSRMSFDVLDLIRKDIERNREKREIVIVVVGIFGRESSSRHVDPSLASGWASREKFRYFEVNFMDRKSLVDPFVYIASKCNPPPPKSSFAPLGLGTKRF